MNEGFGAACNRGAAIGSAPFILFLNPDTRLLIDGKMVVDNGGLHDMQTQDADVDLKAGDHDLRIDYFENENDGGAGCVLSWRPKGMEKEVVPASALSHSEAIHN